VSPASLRRGLKKYYLFGEAPGTGGFLEGWGVDQLCNLNGVDAGSELIDVIVFPNPASDEFTVRLPDGIYLVKVSGVNSISGERFHRLMKVILR